MGVAASTVQTRYTNIATTKSIASGAEAPVMGAVASTPPTRHIGTARAGTSASGAARLRMAQVAYIHRRIATKSSLGS